MDKVDEALTTVNDYLSGYPQIVQFSDALGIKPSFLAVMACGFVFSFLLFGVGGSFIATMIGFFYPCYMSYKALEKDVDVKFWLTYWVVYSLMNMAETFVDYILFWLPMYYFIKLLFLFWLFLPNFRGAEVVFQYVIAPLLRSNEEMIDGALAKGQEVTSEVTKQMSNKQKQ